MKRFIISTLSFGCTFGLVLILVLGIYGYLENGKLRAAFRLPPGITMVAVGDSHTQCALDPESFPHFANFSTSGAPLWMFDFTSRTLISENPGRIKTILLPLSVHKLTEYDSIHASLSEHRLRFLPFVFREPSFVLDTLGHSVFQVVSELLRSIRFRKVIFCREDSSFMVDGFRDSSVCLLESRTVEELLRTHSHFTTVNQWYRTDQDRIPDVTKSAGVQMIVELAKFAQTNDVELVLVTTPYHAAYRQAIPEEWMNVFKKSSEYLVSEGIRHLNFMDVAYPDTCFYDLDHLNATGAERFSAALNAQLLR